ncbi:hypothetical protein FRC00_007961 [Tulasnella sp. 408]|nr:hypothetical protein FRC00_007961 [Tulasnella sp. 408]
MRLAALFIAALITAGRIVAQDDPTTSETDDDATITRTSNPNLRFGGILRAYIIGHSGASFPFKADQPTKPSSARASSAIAPVTTSKPVPITRISATRRPSSIRVSSTRIIIPTTSTTTSSSTVSSTFITGTDNLVSSILSTRGRGNKLSGLTGIQLAADVLLNAFRRVIRLA